MALPARFPLPTPEIHVWVAYLTARCNFACDYCIQKPQMIPGQEAQAVGPLPGADRSAVGRRAERLPVRPEHP